MLRHFAKLFHLFADRLDHHGIRRIAAPAVQLNTAVATDDVTFLYDAVVYGETDDIGWGVARDPVHHFVIDADAQIARKRRHAEGRTGITLEQPFCSSRFKCLAAGFVNLPRRRAWLTDLFDPFMNLMHHPPGGSHLFNLLGRLERNGHNVSPGSASASAANTRPLLAATTKETFIVTHEQTRLDSLNEVKHDAHDNQQTRAAEER